MGEFSNAGFVMVEQFVKAMNDFVANERVRRRNANIAREAMNLVLKDNTEALSKLARAATAQQTKDESAAQEGLKGYQQGLAAIQAEMSNLAKAKEAKSAGFDWAAATGHPKGYWICLWTQAEWQGTWLAQLVSQMPKKDQAAYEQRVRDNKRAIVLNMIAEVEATMAGNK